MTILAPVLTTENHDTTDSTTYTIASSTPVAGKLFLLAVFNGKTTGDCVKPSSIQNWGGSAFNEIGNIAIGVNNNMITCYTIVPVNSTASTILITFPAAQHNCLWKLIEIDGTDVTTPIADSATVQTVGTASTAVMTLSAAPASDTVQVAFLVNNSSSQTITPGTGFTTLGSDITDVTPSIRMHCEVTTPGTPKQTDTITTSSTGYKCGILLSIKNLSTNVPPVAHAGADQINVRPFNTVTLNGSTSTDSDGSIVSYTWTQTGGVNTVALTTTIASNRTFVAPATMAGDTLTFHLVVTDNLGATNSDDVVITVLPCNYYTMKSGTWHPTIIKKL